MTEETGLPEKEETSDAATTDGNQNTDQTTTETAVDAVDTDQTTTETTTETTEPVKKAPEKYEFKAPEGVTIDKTMLEEFEMIARSSDLSQDDAQKLIDIQFKSVQAAEAQKNKVIEDWKERSAKDEILKDPANKAIAQKAIDGYVERIPDDFKAELVELFGAQKEHPGFARFMYEIGKDISDDRFIDGDPGKGKQLTRDERRAKRYPSMT